MDDMDDMDYMDDMKKVEKSQFQRDSAMAGWLTKFIRQTDPHYAFIYIDRTSIRRKKIAPGILFYKIVLMTKV